MDGFLTHSVFADVLVVLLILFSCIHFVILLFLARLPRPLPALEEKHKAVIQAVFQATGPYKLESVASLNMFMLGAIVVCLISYLELGRRYGLSPIFQSLCFGGSLLIFLIPTFIFLRRQNAVRLIRERTQVRDAVLTETELLLGPYLIRAFSPAASSLLKSQQLDILKIPISQILSVSYTCMPYRAYGERIEIRTNKGTIELRSAFGTIFEGGASLFLSALNSRKITIFGI
jgi:hypothetical protein